MRIHQPVVSMFARRLLVAVLLPGLLVLAACRGGAEPEEEARPLSSSEIEAGIAGRAAEVEGCFARARSRNPRISGSVTVSGQVATDGRVETISVARSSVGDDLLERCLARAAEMAGFPEAGAATPFEHTFTVSAKQVRRTRTASADEWPPPAKAGETAEAGEDAPPPISRAAIEDLVERHSDALDQCYRAAIEGDSELAGDVQVTWAVAPSGRVQSAVATGGSIEDEAMRDCVAGVVRGWSFAPTGEAGFRQAGYRFGFRQD